MDCLENKKKRIKIIAGRSNLSLAKKISENLNIPLVDCVLDNFSNTETRININETLRGFHVFIIQTGGFSDDLSINDYKDELYSIVNACKLSNSKSINTIIPFFPNCRQDKKDSSRGSIMSAVNVLILETLGVNRIVSLDLHSGQIQGFAKIPFDNLYAIHLHINELKNNLFKNLNLDQINDQFILASPDYGGAKRTEAFAKCLKMNFVVMHKQRNYTEKSKIINTILIGEKESVKNKTVILIDDIADTLGTMISASHELIRYGAKDIIIMVTHGILSGEAINLLNNSNFIKKIYVTNSLCQEKNISKSQKINIIDISHFISQVIINLVTGRSLSNIF